MPVQFSLVIPTRHRPDYVREALECIKLQEFSDCEVIVSDNFTNPELSCKDVALNSDLSNLIYIQPPRPLSMVDNWNYAFEHASGEYVLYFTDKMMLLPGVLADLARIVRVTGAEMISWTDDSFTPGNYNFPFSAGRYAKTPDRNHAADWLFDSYDPKTELSAKGSGTVPRALMSKSHYTRGKICFGAYSRQLTDRILKKSKSLFLPISPDYTSMILGLAEAKSAVEYSRSGIVHVNTLISNGRLCAIDDQSAKEFLESLDVFEKLMSHGFIPGLFTSVSANVAFDYINLKQQYALDFDFDPVPWLAYAAIEVNASGRTWSSTQVENSQKRLMREKIESLSAIEKQRFDAVFHGFGKPQHESGIAGLFGRLKSMTKSALIDASAFRTLALLQRYNLAQGEYFPSLRESILTRLGAS